MEISFFYSSASGHPQNAQRFTSWACTAVRLFRGPLRRGFTLLQFNQNHPHHFPDLVHHIAVPQVCAD